MPAARGRLSSTSFQRALPPHVSRSHAHGGGLPCHRTDCRPRIPTAVPARKLPPRLEATGSIRWSSLSVQDPLACRHVRVAQWGISRDLDAHQETRLRLAVAFFHKPPVESVAMITTPGRISSIAALGVRVAVALASVGFSPDGARAGMIVANEIRQPGTQPDEVGNLEPPISATRASSPRAPIRRAPSANRRQRPRSSGPRPRTEEPATRHPVS
jgi:hypothetical protein